MGDSDQRKVDAFARMSHELRTLLTGVIGCTGLLLDTELTAEQRDYAKRIRSSGDALLSLLNGILDFTRLEADKIGIECIDFDPRRVVEDVGELLAERAHARGIELCVAVDPAVPPGVLGDPGRLRQVLVNLASNAIKFTPRGRVVLRAAVEEQTESSVLLRLEVEDTGIGISEQGQARLFEAFWQADGAGSHGFGGSGLGLTIARGLCEAMSGRIGCRSVLGRGTTFWCLVPCGRRVASAGRNVIPRIDLAGRRVLVAERDGTAREVVTSMLSALGIEATAVEDGASALRELEEAAARGAPHDVAIVDSNLTDDRGAPLVKSGRTSDAIARTRLVVMSYPGQRPAIGQGGVAAVLAKPVRQSRLANCLFTLLGSHTEHVRVVGPRSTPSGRGVQPGAPRPRVLVVEDDPVNHRIATFMLEKRGYEVDVVEDGLAAVEAALRGGYVAVFMDCQMPKLDGYQATRAIRRAEGSARRTPIIAVTATVGAGARARCFEAGMDDYLSKPIVPEELERVLRQWCAPVPGDASARRVGAGRARAALPASPVPGPGDEPTLERGAIAKLRTLQREGEPDFIAEIFALFARDAPTRLEALREAARIEDSEALERAAHALKGSSSHIGARALQSMCARLEALGRSGSNDGAEALVEAADVELGRVRAALADALTDGRT